MIIFFLIVSEDRQRLILPLILQYVFYSKDHSSEIQSFTFMFDKMTVQASQKSYFVTYGAE